MGNLKERMGNNLGSDAFELARQEAIKRRGEMEAATRYPFLYLLSKSLLLKSCILRTESSLSASMEKK